MTACLRQSLCGGVARNAQIEDLIGEGRAKIVDVFLFMLLC